MKQLALFDRPPLRRVFIGCDGPALERVSRYLLQHCAVRGAYAGLCDLRHVIVALPGARSGRRLLERLVSDAEANGQVLLPPELTTAGHLPDLLFHAPAPFASETLRRFAWVHALAQAPLQALGVTLERD